MYEKLDDSKRIEDTCRQALARNPSATDIADRLVVSRSTVKFHVSSILSKLNAESRTEAVALALKHDLID